jgi:hypothetical protein
MRCTGLARMVRTDGGRRSGREQRDVTTAAVAAGTAPTAIGNIGEITT